MTQELKQAESTSTSWSQDLQHLLAAGRRSDALRMLDRIIENAMPLFGADPLIRLERRLAWLYRIQILRELGRLSEALAWTCLECEMNPENVAAQALKERLKHSLNLTTRNVPPPGHRAQHVQLGNLWAGVAGMREIKAILERDVILPLQEPELYRRYRVDLPNGILLYGPPGCGKTFIARKLAEIMKFRFVEIKPSDLGSIYVHGGQQKIGELFAEAKKNAPTLIFFDELDALVPNRGESHMGHHYAAEVNEFLVQLNECWKSKVLVVGATNLLEKIDPAVRRPGRMDKKVFIGPPDLEARVELLKLYMQNRPQDSISWVRIAEECPLHTSAELEYAVDEAARMALADRRNICDKDIKKALKENPPSLQPEDLEEKSV